jgi:hypothetical protein
MNRTSSHPEDWRLAAIAAGDSDDEAARHVERCADCEAQLAMLREMVGLLSESQALPSPPPWLRTRALAAIRRRLAEGSLWSGFLRLLADSRLMPVPSTVRGPVALGRQLELSGRGIGLDLRLAPAAEETPGRITGQVHLDPQERPGSPADLAIEITDESGERILTRTDEFGMFSIAGRFDLPLLVTIRGREWVEEAFVPEAPL